MAKRARTPGEELRAARAAELRLEPELRALAALGLGLRDWRQFSPVDAAIRWRQAANMPPEKRALLATAIFTGTAQACFRGAFWATANGSTCTVEINCSHLSRPVSRLYPSCSSSIGEVRFLPISTVPMPPSVQLEQGQDGPGITCLRSCHSLDACIDFLLPQKNPLIGCSAARVMMVHYTAVNDTRYESTSYRHCHEDQLFLRTTYFNAFEHMAVDIGEPVSVAISSGAIVHTPGVGILRGPLKEGAPWLCEMPQVDVIWAALQARPQMADQGQYAQNQDRDAMAEVIDRIFMLAVEREADVLVLPPLGCGTHGCHHPALDVADLIWQAARCRGRERLQVIVASDHPAHCQLGWWEAFADAVQHGRPLIQRLAPVRVPPYPRPRKDAAALAEKQRLLLIRRKT